MRLMSYNIHKGVGGRDLRYRLERVVDVIAHEEVDFACLQEVDHDARRTRFDDQATLLAEALGFPYTLYQINHRIKRGGYGNLILSRWPFATHHQISLKMEWRKKRGAQLVVAETPTDRVHLVHWHLGLAERERHWQVRHLLAHNLFRESAELPTLIVGDTNDWRQTLAKGPFAQHGFHQITAPPSRFRSFPAYIPVGSLDKVFVRGPVVIDHARVVHTRLTRVASDHLPVVIDFHVSSGPAASGPD